MRKSAAISGGQAVLEGFPSSARSPLTGPLGKVCPGRRSKAASLAKQERIDQFVSDSQHESNDSLVRLQAFDHRQHRRNRQPDAPPDRDLALSEVEHERDVSIARAADAAERERLARERLAALAPLEARVEVAERRALDAERRLDELTERFTGGPDGAAVAGEGSNGSTAGPEGTPGRAAELRARLTRSAERKRPGREP